MKLERKCNCGKTFSCSWECKEKTRKKQINFCFCTKCFLEMLYSPDNLDRTRLACPRIPEEIKNTWTINILIKKIRGEEYE